MSEVNDSIIMLEQMCTASCRVMDLSMRRETNVPLSHKRDIDHVSGGYSGKWYISLQKWTGNLKYIGNKIVNRELHRKFAWADN